MLMKKKRNLSIAWCGILFSLFTVSCKSVIEEDIEGKKVSINAPTSAQLEEYTQTFWWNAMDGVLNYEVQLVKGSFDHVQQLVFDSLVTGTKLAYTLAPGDYEWRIRGVNGSYKSDYNGSKFTVLVSELNKQFVLLSSPSNGGYAINSPVVFSWAALFGAETYQIQVDENNTFTTGMTLNTFTPATSYVFSTPSETLYYWRVRACTTTDTSMWSSVNSFTYDVTPPDKVVLTSPANNLTDINTETGTLRWTSLGAGIKYIVYIQYGSAAETQSQAISTNSIGYTATAAGQTIKWKVQSVDAAGNKGTISDQWQFKVQ
jgi:hypothetical protein